MQNKRRRTLNRQRRTFKTRRTALLLLSRRSRLWLRSKNRSRCACPLLPLLSLTFSKKASHDEVETKLKKERADLTRFDEELQDLDQVIKEKRQAVADAQLKIKEAEHSITTLQKERSAAVNAVAALEKGNPWIESEKQCVT